jgi:hypothetical protein
MVTADDAPNLSHSAAQPADPGAVKVDRPRMPDGYGLPTDSEGMLTWAQVEERLVAAMQYWMATTRPDGRPHVVPRWGVWLDGRLYYDGSADTVHARNLLANPACTMHLEDGWEAVILDGTSLPSRAEPEELGARLAAAFGKYHDRGYEPGPDSWSGPDGGGLRAFIPFRAIAWFSFPKDATRFRFDNAGDMRASAGG